MENSVNETVANSHQQTSDKEINFQKLRKEHEKAILIAEQERSERIRLQEELERMKSRPSQDEDDDMDYSDPYLEKKSFKKALAKEREAIKREAIQEVRKSMDEERKKDFMYRLKAEYQDFDQVLNDGTIAKLTEANPTFTDMISKIPDEYERRKMAYEAIKTAKLHQKKEDTSLQDKAQKNLANPYYFPSSVGSGPQAMGDFSEAGKKSAYEKMKAMSKNPLNYQTR